MSDRTNPVEEPEQPEINTGISSPRSGRQRLPSRVGAIPKCLLRTWHGPRSGSELYSNRFRALDRSGCASHLTRIFPAVDCQLSPSATLPLSIGPAPGLAYGRPILHRGRSEDRHVSYRAKCESCGILQVSFFRSQKAKRKVRATFSPKKGHSKTLRIPNRANEPPSEPLGEQPTGQSRRRKNVAPARALETEPALTAYSRMQ